MASIRHLENAPITEAIIDFRVLLPDEFDVATFSDLRQELKAEYPIYEAVNRVEANVQFSGRQVSHESSDLGAYGHFYKSAANDRIAQFRRDGFTYNKLKPYSDWDDVFNEAWNLWMSYKRIASQAVVVRIAVRYINHILLVTPFDFTDHFLDPPTIPDNVPQELVNYYKRAVVYDPTSRHYANIIQAIERKQDGTEVRILLDIDAFAQGENMPDGTELRDQFFELRALKNRVFFESITEETARKYE